MDVIRAGYDRHARVELALVPARQVAVVDPAVAVIESQPAEQIPGVHVQVVADVVPGPAFAGDSFRMLGADHHRAMAR